MVTLYELDKNCSGCGACLNICPKSAISMKENKYGFVHPQIDSSLCIECGMCQKVCSFQNKENYSKQHDAYAGVTKDQNILLNSTSGGIFTTLALKFIEDGGYVSGAVYDENFDVKHIVSNKKEDVLKMQGSKYVQSSTENVFKEIRTLLLADEKVLFSGTPCQVDGLYGFLMKEYANLYTIDIVCHGVPSRKLFIDYLNNVKKDDENIVDIKFRDKNQNWGKFGYINLQTSTSSRKVEINSGTSEYYYLFNEGSMFRNSCYSCKYSSDKRPADITIGDFWGIEIVEKELLELEGMNESKGISLIVTNSSQGKNLLNKYKDTLYIYDSTFDNVCRYNHNLKMPSISPKNREYLLDIYSNQKFDNLSKTISGKMKKQRVKISLKKILPCGLKNKLKKILG